MKLFLLLTLLAATRHHAPAPVSLEVIRGGWCAGSRNAFHEEFSLDIEDGVRVFRSWLHQKPALEGTWEFKGRLLTIRGENGDVMQYSVLRASHARLILREKARKDREVYVRPGKCLTFENPYEEPSVHQVTAPPN